MSHNGVIMGRKYMVMREMSQREDKHERKYTVVREMNQREDKHEIRVKRGHRS